MSPSGAGGAEARTVRLAGPADWEGWRAAARRLALEGVPPEAVRWSVGEGSDLFGDAQEASDQEAPDQDAPDQAPAGAADPSFTVPRGFVDLAREAILHADPERFALLHRLLVRLTAGPDAERRLLEVATDPLVARLAGFAKAVRRDIHKMHAFVRFREIGQGDGPGEGPRYLAWFEPGHHIIEAAAPFFQRRFAALRWSILTPERCAHWDGADLAFTDGVSKPSLPDDAAEELWRGYYASIFNPARLKVSAMRSEMPRKYWRNLPEAPLIGPLIQSAQRRTDEMVTASPLVAKLRRQRPVQDPTAEAHALPAVQPNLGDPAERQALDESDLDALREEARACQACPLWANATQTVFGEGSRNADIVFVGEQPGDKEDLAGRPFVGPAGGMFNQALAEAGIARERVYVTNAVKHFKFEPRGKFRLHQKPSNGEVAVCRTWITREIELIRPRLVVAMGATAVLSLFNKAVAITHNRGRLMPLNDSTPALITVHPSYLLRLPDEDQKQREYERFVADLKLVHAYQGGPI